MAFRLDELARLMVSIVTIVLGMTTTASAEKATPSAEALLDRFVEVTGGRAAYDRVTNRLSKGTFALPAQGIEGSLTIWSARPNKLYSVVESDAIGRIERGIDGEVAWERSTMTGPSLKQGQEKADMLRDATFDRWAHWRAVYASAELVGQETVDGMTCDKVAMVPADGTPQTWFFDRESGLLVRVDMTLETRMGTLPIRSRLMDYREVGGIRMPFESHIEVMGQQRVIRMESVEQNVDFPADRFEPPDDVQALAERVSNGSN